MLCSACPQEWTTNGHGLQGCLEWAEWSPWSLLPWQFPDNMRQKKAVCWELGLDFLYLWPASDFLPLSGTSWHPVRYAYFVNRIRNPAVLCQTMLDLLTKAIVFVAGFALIHVKVNVLGLLTTLWSRWITVDVQNEYIYSYVRTAIITSVFLEDKAGFMSLCLKGNSRNLVWDERKPYFLI